MQSHLRVQFLQPRRTLRPYIECYWSWDGNGTFNLPRLLPEPSAELVLYYGQPFRCWSAVRDYGIVPRIHLVGFRDRYYDIESTGPIGFLAVRFKPTGLAFFLGRRPAEWVNDFASASDLWRQEGQALEDSFLSARTLRERVKIVEDFLEGRLSQNFHSDQRWERTLSGVAAAIESHECRVDRIARDIGTTMRSLQRDFENRLGLSPKTYLRLKRFERLITGCLAEPQIGYLARGQDLGYYDQSHIIRDFGEFAGMSPSEFLKEKKYLSLFYNTIP